MRFTIVIAFVFGCVVAHADDTSGGEGTAISTYPNSGTILPVRLGAKLTFAVTGKGITDNVKLVWSGASTPGTPVAASQLPITTDPMIITDQVVGRDITNDGTLVLTVVLPQSDGSWA